MRPPRAALLAAVLLTAAGCGGDRGPDREETGDGLAGLALTAEEVPEGLELDRDRSGEISGIRDVLPPRTTAPLLPVLAPATRQAFEQGHEVRYVGDQSSGLVSLSASVLRFAAAGSASSYLGYLREVQSAPISPRSTGSFELLETPGLGDDGYAWQRRGPGGETSGCSWRRGELVFTLTLAGALGEASPQRAIDLATTWDGRLP